MLSVSTIILENGPVGFSSHPLVSKPVKLLVGLNFSLFVIAFIFRSVVLTNAAAPKVVFAVVPCMFAEGDTLTRSVSLGDVVALGGEVVVFTGFAILIPLLL